MGVQPATTTEHRYQLCRDEFCDRFPCRIYKEGHRNGYEDGYQRGWTEGYAVGYGAGYCAGMAAASSD